MISYSRGNILDSDVEALICPINLVGTGATKGSERRFRKQFPQNHRAYQLAANEGSLRPGQMLVFKTNQPFIHKYIINFPVKRHWSTPSLILDIESGMIDLIDVIKNNNIKSVAIGALGTCGPCGLDWEIVKPFILRPFYQLPHIRVDIYEPKPVTMARMN